MRVFPVRDPFIKTIAQKAKWRHKKKCRKCGRTISISRNKCFRCGSRCLQIIHHNQKKS